ncbi:phosphatase PAP2 family protein [Sphingomonas abietis]|uniref:Phosphatase PAP2 family protein n=1 Tax=Sphingomonas abietis TaxID=3012344 RepID=A0ABY7NPW4_9SPHN|nr:phosphatase PAP2 family protein [Sphingomonas abietis]WBO22845.1 phosphatase PAP2 family protein [Sphingomonas abietis]
MTGMRSLAHPSVPAIDRVPLLPGRWIGAAVAASLLATTILLLHVGLRIAASPALVALMAWAVGAVIACYLLRAPATPAQRIARDAIEGISLFGLFSLLGAIASYPLAAGHHALVDSELERIDLGLHFHWVSWYEIVAGDPLLQAIERVAYLSIFVTPAIIICHFAWAGRRAEIRRFIATFWVAAVMTLALFPLFPAAGPLATLWHGSTPYMPLSALYQEQVILALRDHAIQSIDLGALHGLVCAPSFHAASAVIYIVTASRIAALRWPIIALNITMLLATPVEGTHYFTDILSGAAVACIAIWLTRLLVARSASPLMGWDARFEQPLTAAE